MTPTDPEDPHVLLFGRRLPVGDFRPWIRLLVMGGMLTAVSLAARSLSRRIAEDRLDARFAALAEIEDRLEASPAPLSPIVGFPDPWHSTPELRASEASPLTGRIVDLEERPLAGARVSIPNESAVCDAAGRFRLAAHSPAGGAWLQVDPPAARGELASVVIERTPPSIPGLATSVGTLRLPKKASRSEGASNPKETAPGPGAPAAGAPRRALFRSKAPSGAPSLADWTPVRDGERVPEAEWLRALEVGGGEARLSPPFHPGEEKAPKALPTTIFEGWLAGDASEPLESPSVLLDLFGSGLCLRATLDGDPKNRRFLFPRAPDGDHRLLVLATGHLPLALDLALPLPPRPGRLSLALERGADVEVSIPASEVPVEGLALRVSGERRNGALLAVTPGKTLVLRGLPPDTLRFELVASCSIARATSYAAPPFERIAPPVVRTLVPGPKNPKIALHLPKDGRAAESAVRGEAPPGSWVYRFGARLDEPTSLARADAEGRFELCAPPGARLFAARGSLPNLEPFAAGVAGERVVFGEPVALQVEVLWEGKRVPGVPISLRLTGPESLGRCVFRATSGPDGRARFTELPSEVPYEVDALLEGAGAAASGVTPKTKQAVVRLEASESP